MSVARFDEPLHLRHLSADGTVPCPRGIPIREKPFPLTPPEHGTLLRVTGCALSQGHDGDCQPRVRYTQRTRCGLRMDDTPWVAVDTATDCPTCYRDAP